MSKINRVIILETTKKLFAKDGPENLSIRSIAQEMSVAPSIIYYYFSTKDVLLKQMFDYTRHNLGLKRQALDNKKDFANLLKDRILFQLNNSLDVCVIMKYFFSNHPKFPLNQLGYVPQTAYQHIKEILLIGSSRNEITNQKIDENAKIITHAINGFVMEYYPHSIPNNQKIKLSNQLANFFIQALRKEVKN